MSTSGFKKGEHVTKDEQCNCYLGDNLWTLLGGEHWKGYPWLVDTLNTLALEFGDILYQLLMFFSNYLSCILNRWKRQNAIGFNIE